MRWFRRRRGALLLRQVPDLRELKIIDVGGSRHFWQESETGVPPAHITIYNLDGAGDSHGVEADGYAQIAVRAYDGVRLPEADGAFDVAVCNSVIEHVPAAQRAGLVAELRRVAKRVVLQTPAKSFPLEPHFLVPFIQFLPRRAGYAVVKFSPWRIFGRPSPATIESYYWGTNLLTLAELEALLPDATIHHERWCGLTKSYIAIV
jgi:hypothetical protein